MRTMNMKKAISKTQLLLAAMVAMALLLTAPAHAATPGITGTTFNLTAQAAVLSQPDGQPVYSWGYGCATGFPRTFAAVSPRVHRLADRLTEERRLCRQVKGRTRDSG